MRNRDFLAVAGACALGLVASLSFSSPASAYAGLSERQRAHIAEYFHCRHLLWTDIPAFEADPVCGGPPNLDRQSMLESGNGAPPSKEPPACEYPSYSSFSVQSVPVDPPSCYPAD